jgi:tetratricopeptide (TPR) repeat protein
VTATDIPEAIATGIGHHRAGRLSEAETIYRTVLSVDSTNPDALNLLGAIAHQSGRYRQAIDYIRRAIASYEQAVPAKPPNPYAYSNLGEAYRAAGDSDNAKACYEKALAIRPDYAEAHYHLGLVLADQGDDDQAIACYRKALSLKPELLLAIQPRCRPERPAQAGRGRDVFPGDPRGRPGQRIGAVFVVGPDGAESGAATGKACRESVRQSRTSLRRIWSKAQGIESRKIWLRWPGSTRNIAESEGTFSIWVAGPGWSA